MPDATEPPALRQAMADYVAALHRAYLDASDGLTPGELGRIPLVAQGDFTVAAVGTRNLHVIATSDTLAPPTGPEVELPGHEGPLTWRLRFFDPVVIPALGLIDESQAPAQAEVRAALGFSAVLYHLTVPPGGGLSAHHAQHAGTGLAHTHAAASRDYDTMTHLAPRSAGLLNEMRAAESAGLDSSVLLLARVVAPHDPDLANLPVIGTPAAASRTQLLAALRGHSPEPRALA